MKTRLVLRPHTVLGATTSVIEVWYDGTFLATITGADGPGVRILSKHRLCATLPGQPVSVSIDGNAVNTIEVDIASS